MLASAVALACATASAVPAGSPTTSPGRTNAAAAGLPVVIDSAEGVPIRLRQPTPDNPKTYIPAVNSHLADIHAEGTCVPGAILMHVLDLDSCARSDRPEVGSCTSSRAFEISRLVDAARDRLPSLGRGLFARGDRVELTFTEFPAGEETVGVVITRG